MLSRDLQPAEKVELHPTPIIHPLPVTPRILEIRLDFGYRFSR